MNNRHNKLVLRFDDEVITLLFPVAEVSIALRSLEKFAGAFEQQLPGLISTEEGLMWDRLSKQGLTDDDAERQAALDELHETVELAYPRLFRSSLLVVLWAHFEAAVKRLAGYLQSEHNATLALDDIAGSDFLRQARTYFDKVIEVPLVKDNTLWEKLEILRATRNTIAHHAGAVGPKATRERFQRWEKAGKGPPFDVLRGEIQPTPEYVASALNAVSDALESLMRRAGLEWLQRQERAPDDEEETRANPST